LELKDIKNVILKISKNSKITPKMPKPKHQQIQKSCMDASNEKSSQYKLKLELNNVKNNMFKV
jgi:hypothetical protein